jgi:Host cell surface-exposed lipoprotein
VKKILAAVAATAALAAPLALTAAPAEAHTGPQRQAIGMARDYLDTMPFSKAGLADQLRYEGFSRRVANYAVDHIRVSWRTQAVKSGRSYLRVMHFSCSGLIDQLEYEKFTHRQAVYGAHHTRAC